MATIEKNIYVKCLSNIYSEIAIKAHVPFSHFNPMKILKVIYKGSFKSFVALCADRICSDQHFVENCIEKFPSV